MTRKTLIELSQVKNAAVYRQCHDEHDEQRLDLPVALQAAPSQAFPLAPRTDLASLRWRRTTGHHSRRSSSPPRRGDSMRHGAACLRHRCKRDWKIKSKIEKEWSKENVWKCGANGCFSMIWRYSLEWNVGERERIYPTVEEDMMNKKKND